MILQRSDLFGYQDRFAEFVKSTPYCAGWLDMGLGKTVSTLTAFADLSYNLHVSKLLVVAPLRVARKVWSDEIKRWSHLHGLRVSHIIGTPRQRWEAMHRDADVYCINREQIPWLEVQFIDTRDGKKFKQIRKWPWDMVVLDESQSFKSWASDRFKSMRRIRRYLEVERIVELTGTPSPNGYTDLWSQIHLLDLGKRLGGDPKAFVDRWFSTTVNDASYTTYELRPSAEKEIRERLGDIVMAMRSEDYLGVPDVRYNDVMVELPAKAMATYKELERKSIAEVQGQKLTAVNAGALCNKLLQLANGAVYHDDKGNWTHIHDEKLEALEDLLEASSGPVMIAYGFKHDLHRIQDRLASWCARSRNHKSFRVLKTERDEDDWNAKKIDFLLLHPASAGHGLNLQHSGSETIIWFGLTANLEWYQQLNARLIGGHRATGKKVLIHRILAEDTRDRWMSELIDTKGAVQDDLTRYVASLR